jgi:hypothetical protein
MFLLFPISVRYFTAFDTAQSPSANYGLVRCYASGPDYLMISRYDTRYFNKFMPTYRGENSLGTSADNLELNNLNLQQKNTT